MRLRAIVPLAALALVSAACAEEGTKVVQASIPFEALNWSKSMTVDQFNNPYVTLTSVDIAFSGTSRGSMKFENRDPIARTYSARVCTILDLTSPTGSSLLSIHPKCSLASGTLARFDGTLDYQGPSAATYTPDPATETGSATLTGADLTPYIGSGTVALPIAARVTTFLTIPGNFASEIRSEAAADIQLTYHYTFERGSLGDKVFIDANSNGVQDANEAGKGGVTVELIDASGTVINTTTTDAEGLYHFTGLMPGEYQVKFTAPAGTQFTTANVGDDALDSDAGTGGLTEKVIVHSGENVTTVDAGLVGLQSLGDRVWFDTNANGIQDAGEMGISGVGVTLLNGSGNAVGTTTTDANGLYSFSGLLPGDYKVKFDAVQNYVRSPLGVGNDVEKDSNAGADGTTAKITLNAGDARTDIDAGYYGLVSIGDRVWFDSNANGKQDAGEGGLQGVTVNLLDGGGNVIQTELTDANGNYLFTELAPGNYQIQVVQPSGYAFTVTKAGSNDAIDSDVDGSGLSSAVALTADNLNVDAGLIGSLKLGDRVWRDDNGNGLQDANEPGVVGVTVNLLDKFGNVIATTTTGTNGIYGFSNLVPGDYSVQFVAPAGYGFSKQFAKLNNNPAPTADSNADVTTGLASVTLAANDLTIDAGLVGGLKIGDQVWLDSDGDGKFEPEIGEVGLSNVKVIAYADLDGNGSIDYTATVKTNGSGVYNFNSLLPGTYRVVIDSTTLPAGVVATYDLDGTGTLNFATAKVTADNLNFDFGYRLKTYSGVGTPGYWKNHPEAWPTDTLTIGGVTYTKSQAISIIGNPTKGDYTQIMFRAVACAKLNVGSGNAASMLIKFNGVNVSIEDLIRQGDAWLAKYPVGSKPSEAAWNLVSAIATAIDNYNNGQYGIPHR